MKPASSKDYFAILGVEPTAAPEEIRKAYLDRAREIHPDRFDFRTQPAEWRQANDELALLNEAYAALRGEVGWVSEMEAEREGDQAAEGRPPGWGQAEAASAAGEEPPCDLGELAPGEADFDDLPKSSQARLLARQKGLIREQWRVSRRRPLGNVVSIAGLAGWFGFLFFHADRSEWASTTLMVYTAVTTFIGLLIGRNLMILLRCARSPLKPAFYLTPVYFIRTDFHVVSFFPLWSLESASASSSRRVLSPCGVEVKLQFGPHLERLRFLSRRAAEGFEMRLRAFERGFRHAVDGKRSEYIRENDDFLGFRRQTRTVRAGGGNRFGEYSALVLPLLASWAVFVVAVDQNLKWTQDRLIRHPESLMSSGMNPPKGQVGRPERPGPLTGGIPTPAPADVGLSRSASPIPVDPPDAPPRGTQGGPSHPDPYGEKLATFQDSKGFLLESGAPDGSEGSMDYKFREVQQAPTPVNGHLTRYHAAGEAIAPMEIKVPDAGRDFYCILEEWESRRTVLTVFVRGGQTVRFNVPLGAYRMKYAAGEKWYGESHLFGAGTVYGASRDRMDFTLEGDKVTSRKVEISMKAGTSEDGRAQTE